MGNRWTEATNLGRAALALVAALVVAGGGLAMAEADGPDYYRVVGVAEDDVLHIRKAADPQADKVGSMPPDADCVRNLGCQGGLSYREFSTLTEPERAERLKRHPRWCKIEYLGVTGWVAGRYLAEGGCGR
ncbi:MAG: SH3 domain-containing protein [Thiohalocapsa sp.]